MVSSVKLELAFVSCQRHAGVDLRQHPLQVPVGGLDLRPGIRHQLFRGGAPGRAVDCRPAGSKMRVLRIDWNPFRVTKIWAASCFVTVSRGGTSPTKEFSNEYGKYMPCGFKGAKPSAVVEVNVSASLGAPNSVDNGSV